MNPAVDAIDQIDLPKPIPGPRCRGRDMTIHDTEESPLATQFNEYLMTRLYPAEVSYPSPSGGALNLSVNHWWTTVVDYEQNLPFTPVNLEDHQARHLSANGEHDSLRHHPSDHLLDRGYPHCESTPGSARRAWQR